MISHLKFSGKLLDVFSHNIIVLVFSETFGPNHIVSWFQGCNFIIIIIRFLINMQV